jgi:phosphoenolpyruvate carboxylase
MKGFFPVKPRDAVLSVILGVLSSVSRRLPRRRDRARRGIFGGWL